MMKTTILTTCLGVGSALFSVTAVASATAHTHSHSVLTESNAFQKAHTPSINESSTQLLTYMKNNTQQLNVGEIQRMLEAPQNDTFAKERLIYDFLFEMRQHTPTDAIKDFVSEYETYENEVLIWHPEGPLPVPLFSIQEAAKGLRGLWARSEAMALAISQSENGDFLWLTKFDAQSTATNAERDGLIHALETMPLQMITAAKPSVIEMDRRSPYVLDAQVVVAERTHDKTLLEALLSEYSNPRLVKAINTLPESFSSDDAFELLKTSQSNARLASASLMAMAQLLPNRDIESYLMASLNDPALGGTAAAALASRDEAHIIDALGNRLITSSDPKTQARCALALRLNQSAPAREYLAQFVSTAAPTQLTQEVQKWLTR